MGVEKNRTGLKKTPEMLWCSKCRCAHEPSPHHDKPRSAAERRYIQLRNISNEMQSNRAF